MGKIDDLSSRFERAWNKGISHIEHFIRNDRRTKVLVKVLFGIMGVAVSLWVMRYEFGEGLTKSPEFIILIAVWTGYGILVFFDELAEAKESTTGEKIDSLSSKFDLLIAEVKGLREDARSNKNTNT